MTFGQVVKFNGVYGDWMIVSYENDSYTPAVMVFRVRLESPLHSNTLVRYWVSNIACVWDDELSDWREMP